MSFNTAVEASEFSKQILQTLGNRYLALPNRNTLEILETLWTGHGILGVLGKDINMYTQLRVSYFINHEWHQVRQLSYLAVTDEAMPLIQACAGLRRLPGRLDNGCVSNPQRTENTLTAAIKATLEDRTVRLASRAQRQI
jgi:hypothetical protein